MNNLVWSNKIGEKNRLKLKIRWYTLERKCNNLLLGGEGEDKSLNGYTC